MKIVPEQEACLREQVREMVALNPMISVRALQKAVEHNIHRSISDKYLMRLLHKVRREAVVQTDRAKLAGRLTEVRERYQALRHQLYRIAYWQAGFFPKHGIPKPKAAERVAAIKLIAQMDLALLKAEADIGLFEDRRAHLEEMLRAGLLPQELHEEVVAVFRRHRLLRASQTGVV